MPSLREQQVIARWLSTGIADAVAQYVKQRDIETQRQTSEHLGFIAHELRNPLGTARLAFARMQQAAPEAFANARWADVLERNLRRTMELINNVLGQASLQLGVEPAIQRVDLKSFLEELVADAEAESQSRNITVTLSAREGIPLEVDPRLMRSAISNLLDNALKFSHPDSYIDLIVTQPEGRVLIDVIDPAAACRRARRRSCSSRWSSAAKIDPATGWVWRSRCRRRRRTTAPSACGTAPASGACSTSICRRRRGLERIPRSRGA